MPLMRSGCCISLGEGGRYKLSRHLIMLFLSSSLNDEPSSQSVWTRQFRIVSLPDSSFISLDTFAICCRNIFSVSQYSTLCRICSAFSWSLPKTHKEVVRSAFGALKGLLTVHSEEIVAGVFGQDVQLFQVLLQRVRYHVNLGLLLQVQLVGLALL